MARTISRRNQQRFYYRCIVKTGQLTWTVAAGSFMGSIHSHEIEAAILAIDNRFRTPSIELKCLGTSFSAQKPKVFNSGLNIAAVRLRPIWRPNPEIVQHPDRSEMKGMHSRNVERNQVLVTCLGPDTLDLEKNNHMQCHYYLNEALGRQSAIIYLFIY